jgi:adenylate cyclase, class 2
MPARNIELKARYADLDRAEQIALGLGARPAGTLIQTDTYFHVPQGRLKLRETEPAHAELIWYDRPDQAEPRPSDYTIIPLADSEPLRTVLAGALGISARVHKRRRLLLWQNVRIHLDEVTGLGTFLEFEAVLSQAEPAPSSQNRLNHLAEAFQIAPSDRVAGSYSDMVLRHTHCQM